MSVQTFEIPGRLLGRNEREALARSHWSKSNAVKRDETTLAMACAMEAGLKPVSGPVDVSVIFREQVNFFKNGKRKKPRDADNIQDGCKPILDGLVKAGVIPDDGPDWVRRVIPTVKYVRDDPKITVVVMDYEPVRRVVYPPVNIPECKEDK